MRSATTAGLHSADATRRGFGGLTGELVVFDLVFADLGRSRAVYTKRSRALLRRVDDLNLIVLFGGGGSNGNGRYLDRGGSGRNGRGLSRNRRRWKLSKGRSAVCDALVDGDKEVEDDVVDDSRWADGGCLQV